MPASTKNASVRRTTRAPRSDGAATRQHLLEVAGQLFAERGFADTTSKEICERAGTPMASINYHFGSREALYEAALIDAHRQIVGLDELVSAAESGADSRAKLRAVLSQLVKLSTNGKRPWGFMLMLREVLSPSPAIPALVTKAVRPKAAFMLALVAEVLGLEPTDAAVQRAVMFVVLPCIAMMIAPKQIQKTVLPAAGKDVIALSHDYVNFAMGGLEAIAAEHGSRANRTG
ncbi:CerR family C-terminal domain-containing protein [Burkholderia dolosa]|jgi:AcrR family transcriptional regulator|uniref:TetR/AcrR family transcriptional regulator n=1 Tax=Burkholderia dolosa TaxID=152500 RepID=UPI001BA12DCF|nr:CerR family C-terminal domain-containing protein [Burkholderia dolosa]MBR8460416.1 CerR family C-terminal domain-containing protein [Burkholderia dolosa]MDN7421656.1 CerR family C-terminal domain-containing protein [Burkholderia dolosa]